MGEEFNTHRISLVHHHALRFNLSEVKMVFPQSHLAIQVLFVNGLTFLVLVLKACRLSYRQNRQRLC